MSFISADQEKVDPVRFSEIARVLLVRPIIPMFMYTEAAASDAVAFRIIERLRRLIVQADIPKIINRRCGLNHCRMVVPEMAMLRTKR